MIVDTYIARVSVGQVIRTVPACTIETLAVHQSAENSFSGTRIPQGFGGSDRPRRTICTAKPMRYTCHRRHDQRSDRRGSDRESELNLEI